MGKMNEMTTLSIAGKAAGQKLLEAAQTGDGISMRRVLKDHHDLIAENAPQHLTKDELQAYVQSHMHPLICMKDAQGNTALHLAAAHAKPEQRNPLVRTLVEAGSDMSARNNNGKTAREMVPEPKSFVQRLTGKRDQAPTASLSV